MCEIKKTYIRSRHSARVVLPAVGEGPQHALLLVVALGDVRLALLEDVPDLGELLGRHPVIEALEQGPQGGGQARHEALLCIRDGTLVPLALEVAVEDGLDDGAILFSLVTGQV